jgi:hypothetical protein
MAETKDETEATGPADEPEHEPAGPMREPTHDEPPPASASSPGAGSGDAGHVCNVAFCPIGLALTAVQPLKPDVVEHLLLAGREFFLAAKALMDVRADDLSKDGGSPTFEKIDIG